MNKTRELITEKRKVSNNAKDIKYKTTFSVIYLENEFKGFGRTKGESIETVMVNMALTIYNLNTKLEEALKVIETNNNGR